MDMSFCPATTCSQKNQAIAPPNFHATKHTVCNVAGVSLSPTTWKQPNFLHSVYNHQMPQPAEKSKDFCVERINFDAEENSKTLVFVVRSPDIKAFTVNCSIEANSNQVEFLPPLWMPSLRHNRNDAPRCNLMHDR